MATSKVVDLITAAPQPVIKSGDFLVAPSVPAGNIQTIVESDGSVPNGQNLFVVVGVGTPDGTTGVYPQNDVYPVKIVNGAYVADTSVQPIIIQTAGQVRYVGGRNSSVKDVYNQDGVTTVTVADGAEPKEVLKAFLKFASEQFAFGVNQFEQGDCLYIAES